MNSDIPLKCSICPKSFIDCDGKTRCEYNMYTNKRCALSEKELKEIINDLGKIF
jgi:hypothetical protein